MSWVGSFGFTPSASTSSTLPWYRPLRWRATRSTTALTACSRSTFTASGTWFDQSAAGVLGRGE